MNHLASLMLPAEWTPHEATWLAWPHNQEDWPGKFGPIPWVYGEIVKHLSRVEKVHILVDDATETEVSEVLTQVDADLQNVELHRQPTDRVWVRDFGPLFARQSSGLITPVKWRFNAWAKYDNWQRDDAAGHFIAEHVSGGHPIHVARSPDDQEVVLEGGSIDVNGAGTLLTTEECLLSHDQERNPGLGRSDYEALFARYLGIRKTLWLKRGIAGDDTHGHVDDIARFVDPTTLVIAVEQDRGDINHAPLQENLEYLREQTDADGRKLVCVPLPMPAPLHFRGQRLPASYANFYIANELVLVPTFNDVNDRRAVGILAELFPERNVIGIHCGDLVWGLGTLHCMTMQQPAMSLLA